MARADPAQPAAVGANPEHVRFTRECEFVSRRRPRERGDKGTPNQDSSLPTMGSHHAEFTALPAKDESPATRRPRGGATWAEPLDRLSSAPRSHTASPETANSRGQLATVQREDRAVVRRMNQALGCSGLDHPYLREGHRRSVPKAARRAPRPGCGGWGRGEECLALGNTGLGGSEASTWSAVRGWR